MGNPISRIRPNHVDPALGKAGNMLSETNNLAIQKDCRKETDDLVQFCAQKLTLFATVYLTERTCNGKIEKEETKEEETKRFRSYFQIVQELVPPSSDRDQKKFKDPGLNKIRSVMLKHFPHISLFRTIFWYYLFIKWVPKRYINSSINKTLSTIRTELDDGKKLPEFGVTIFTILNSHLENVNRVVHLFAHDKNTVKNKENYASDGLKSADILSTPTLKIKNEKELFDKLAETLSNDALIPKIKFLSKTIKKIQILKFKILKNIPSIILLPIKAVTISLFAIPYFIAKKIEDIPNNLIIKRFHKKLIENLTPGIIHSSLDAIKSSNFLYAINTFLCEVIQDFSDELKMSPETRPIELRKNVISDELAKKIKNFANELYDLLLYAPYQKQEELKSKKQNGFALNEYGINPHPLVQAVSLAIRKFAPTFIDSKIKEQVVDNALYPAIKDGFNFLFSKPEKFEEYLSMLIKLLNNIYNENPDSSTHEGQNLITTQNAKNKEREENLDTLLETLITRAFDPQEILNDLKFSYRKIHKLIQDTFPILEQDANNLIKTTETLRPNSIQAKEMEEILDREITALERFFDSFEDILPLEKTIERSLTDFGKTKKNLQNITLQMNSFFEYFFKFIEPLLPKNESTKEIIASLNKIQQRVKENTKQINSEFEDLFKSISTSLPEDDVAKDYKLPTNMKLKLRNHTDKIKSYFEEIKLLKHINETLQSLNKVLNDSSITFHSKIDLIIEHLNQLQKNKNVEFCDDIISKYNNLLINLNNIKSHSSNIDMLKPILSNTFFKDGLFQKLKKAQGEYLKKQSDEKERKVMSLKNEILKIINNFKGISTLDIHDMEIAIRNIYNSSDAATLLKEYTNSEAKLREKLDKYTNQLSEENDKYNRNLTNYQDLTQHQLNDLIPQKIYDKQKQIQNLSALLPDMLKNYKTTLENLENFKYPSMIEDPLLEWQHIMEQIIDIILNNGKKNVDDMKEWGLNAGKTLAKNLLHKALNNKYVNSLKTGLIASGTLVTIYSAVTNKTVLAIASIGVTVFGAFGFDKTISAGVTVFGAFGFDKTISAIERKISSTLSQSKPIAPIMNMATDNTFFAKSAEEATDQSSLEGLQAKISSTIQKLKTAIPEYSLDIAKKLTNNAFGKIDEKGDGPEGIINTQSFYSGLFNEAIKTLISSLT
ncbi:MAG: hypothetical protein KR126chlam6_00057 [Candidatus Anoxychlamydiales bacterium]|nr:hypothetical protein [Candidatus Anoxychlamydiales bacterium]